MSRGTILVCVLAAIVAVGATSWGFRAQRRHQAAELGKLRTEVFLLRQRVARAARPTAPVPTAAVDAPVSGAAVASEPAAPAFYRNEGNATPLAALQTFAWACDRADPGIVRRLVFIDPAARAKAEAVRAAMPADVQARWATLEDMAAELLTHAYLSSPFPRADVLATATPETIAPDRVRMRLPGVPKDGTEYQFTADGWRFVVTERMVDDYVRSRQQAKAP